MNTRDLSEIHLRLTASNHHLQRLHLMTTFYQGGKVIVAEIDLPLTAGQRNILKGAFTSLAAKINVALGTLATPTGKAGVVDVKVVTEVQRIPGKLFIIVKEMIEQNSEIVELLKPLSSIEADGSIVSTPLTEQDAQNTANSLETFASAAKWWIGQEAAKF